MADRSDCTCLTQQEVNSALIRGERFGTKEPCPIHETPEKLAELSKYLIPKKPYVGPLLGPYTSEGRHG